MAERIPQPGQQHPEHWRQDLNPDPLGGQNVGVVGPHPEQGGPTAHDVKEVHRYLSELEDDELTQIPVLRTGDRLEQGATYLDLNHPQFGEITARGDMVAGPDNWFVPKAAVPYEVWNKLLSILPVDPDAM